MANATSARLVSLNQAPAKRAKSGAERAKAYRQRKKAGKEVAPAPPDLPGVRNFRTPSALPDFEGVQESSTPAACIVLAVSAVGLAAVGLSMNAWFARSVGSTDIAGWLFLAIGVASDLAALAVPSVAARAWQAKRRGAALAGCRVGCLARGVPVRP